jgi:hypothetical protein
MTEIWAKLVGASDDGLDYWGYWGIRMVEHAEISPGAEVLDAGTGDTGSSLFPAAILVLYDEWLIKPESCNCDVGGGLQLITTYYNFLQGGQVWTCGYVIKVLFGFSALYRCLTLNLSR